MRRSLGFMLVFVLLVSVFAAGSVSAQTDTRPVYDPYNRINFTYSTQIAQDATIHYVAATTDPNVPTGLVPEYAQIDFQNFVDGTGWVSTGQSVYVYPVVTFPTDPSQPFAQALANLRSLLASQTSVPENSWPMLPIVTAAPYFHSQIQVVNFAGGSGIRYVTAAGLDVSPMSAHTMFYSFQGLTNDGQYYIAAMIPVQPPALLNDPPVDMTTEQYNQFSANFESYLTEVTAFLNSYGPDNFWPTLSMLDTAMASLQINPPAAMFVNLPGVTSTPVTYNNISFSYDAALASRVEVDEIAPFTDPGGMSMYGSLPGWSQFTFMGYQTPGPYLQPQIYVYAVDGFPQDGSIVDQMLARVQAFLAARAPQTAFFNASGSDTIPVLPLINAQQVFVAKPQYLDFQNGSGIRFVTAYAQSPNPITNHYLLYQFVGLTADGRYVIAAEFPISASILQAEVDNATFDYDAFMATFNDTMTQTVVSLDALDVSGFAPDLTRLDALMGSIRVG